MIEESGDKAFRVTDLAERCNVAIGLLYHYFKDRDGLIAAVRESQFLAHIETDLELLKSISGHQGDVGHITQLQKRRFRFAGTHVGLEVFQHPG